MEGCKVGSKTEVNQRIKQQQLVSDKPLMTTKFLVKVAILSVLGFLIMFVEMIVPLFPSFLKLDLSDIPALIGSFSLGPIAGITIEFIKNILHFIFKSQTGGVGEAANFLVGSVFVVVSSIIYNIKKNKAHALMGIILGTIVMAVVAGVMNYYILIPLFAKIFGAPIEAFVDIGAKVTPLIKDLKTLIIFSIVPFNLLKGIIVGLVTMVIYKKISPILHR